MKVGGNSYGKLNFHSRSNESVLSLRPFPSPLATRFSFANQRNIKTLSSVAHRFSLAKVIFGSVLYFSGSTVNNNFSFVLFSDISHFRRGVGGGSECEKKYQVRDPQECCGGR